MGRFGLHVVLNVGLFHLFAQCVFSRQTEAEEVNGWNGAFRFKQDVPWIPALHPFIKRLERLSIHNSGKEDTVEDYLLSNHGSRRYDLRNHGNQQNDLRNNGNQQDDSSGKQKRESLSDSAQSRTRRSAENPYIARNIGQPNDNFNLSSEYKLYMRTEEEGSVTKETEEEIKDVFSNILHIPPSHVRLHQVGPKGVWQLDFVSYGALGKQQRDFIPAKDVEATIATSGLQGLPSNIQVQEIYVQDEVNRATVSESESKKYILVYVIGGSAVGCVALILLTLWCYMKSRRYRSEQLSGRSSPSPPPHIPQQICLYPSTKPQVKNATLIQPDVTQIFTNKSCGECGTPVHTPPMKLKMKGLLERRGSNASLTLDLGPSTPESKPTWGSPPKESSADEYLLSAGNRMSRKQLRNCLRDPKALHEEFWEIPMNHPDKVEIAGSGVKNRYRTIIPNEGTRVLLCDVEADPLSSYINANYIRGYAGEGKAFIATQGPMAHTVNDFWKMIWLVKSPIIVMITKLKEKNKTKCESYMPVESGTYGDIHVHIDTIVEKEAYILRQITLQYLNEQHRLLHYWYTSWPDHKAPNTARQLLHLVKEVEKHRCHSQTHLAKGPVIVHCSAGIGRTGCFISASIGMRQLYEEHMVDILGIICQMRLDRGGMVQTIEQYEFVHQALSLYEKELPDRPPSSE